MKCASASPARLCWPDQLACLPASDPGHSATDVCHSRHHGEAEVRIHEVRDSHSQAAVHNQVACRSQVAVHNPEADSRTLVAGNHGSQVAVAEGQAVDIQQVDNGHLAAEHQMRTTVSALVHWRFRKQHPRKDPCVPPCRLVRALEGMP